MSKKEARQVGDLLTYNDFCRFSNLLADGMSSERTLTQAKQDVEEQIMSEEANLQELKAFQARLEGL